MWYLIGLIWIALLAGMVVLYNRRQKKRSAAQAEKIAALLADLKSGAATAAKTEPAAAAPAAPAALAEFRKKQRLLPQSTALVYYIFRTGLPDHEVFTGLTLADVLEPAPVSSMTGQGQISKLMAQRLDLVVCTKQLEVVAGVVIGARSDPMRAAAADVIAPCLQSAGIRLLRVDPAAAPRHHEVRGLIYGESG